jgi:hypothetical protein
MWQEFSPWTHGKESHQRWNYSRSPRSQEWIEMRMWMVDPKLMCRQHLLGEHSEIHKHRHVFVKKWSVSNRIVGNQIEPSSMETRHDSLVKEMLRRGYNHKSPYEQPDISYLPSTEQYYKVNVESSYSDLKNRCPHCCSMQNNS